VKVVGAGFGRTGTTSLKAALETLGFGPCYHMIEVFENPEHTEVWRAAWRGEPVDWESFIGDYESAVDWPACSFYEDLTHRYPDAKVLLSVRDSDGWYESTRNTIYELTRTVLGSPLSRAVFALVGLFLPGGLGTIRMVEEIVWQGTFDGRFEDRAHAIGVFERWNEEVRQRVPPDRLLVYEVKQGWGPLCEFLGVEEPDEPFPHANDAAEMRRRIRLLKTVSFAVPAMLIALVATALVLLGRRAGS
jgi:Sulfotransferase domain